MATVTHIIRSHYDPADRERLEAETGQFDEGQLSDPWQTESSFSAQRRLRAPPSFIPATISYDEWGVPLQLSEPSSSGKPDQPSTSAAEWYKSLTAASSVREVPTRPSSAPSPNSQVSRPPEKSLREIITKNNWFISKALRSEPTTKPSSPAPSLAELLARDPPPLPSEERYKPPVWLHIGPSNKGFAMLQQSGWNEGEGLGAHVARPLTHGGDEWTTTSDRRSVSKMKLSESFVKAEETTATIHDIREVIDLTQSDSEESEEGSEDLITDLPQTQAAQDISDSHMQRSLLTPLPTVLKADRLGIGLKAKTEGPYKQSKKRVTHNAAALAAHIRSAEEMRRRKAEVGRGQRGFAKIRKREEESRKVMLAYLNE